MNPAPGRGRRTKWLELAAIGFLTVAIIALGYFAFHETIGLFAGSDTPGHPDLAPPRMIGPADPAAPRPRKAEAITAMPQVRMKRWRNSALNGNLSDPIAAEASAVRSFDNSAPDVLGEKQMR